MSTLLAPFSAHRLIGITRTASAADCLWASGVLIDSGFRLIEVPYTVPDATQVIETLCDRYPQATIGAGTILEAGDAVRAMGAGAQFLVAPTLVEPLIRFGLENQVLTLPGCMTPTEIERAYSLGAPAVKFFPAESAGGAGFVSALRGPLPHIPLVATGGIHLQQVAGYFQAGALAVGVGAPLIPTPVLVRRDEAVLRDLAHQYLAARDAAMVSAPSVV